MCAVQLNEAEYAGPFIAALGILAIKGIEAPIASSLAVFGQVGYDLSISSAVRFVPGRS